MVEKRPAIPLAVKQEVRRACGFGCVVCGVPIFHYDHIVDYAEIKEHTVSNLALLCPNHHQDKTSRRLPRAVVSQRRLSPFNLGRDKSAPHRWYFSGSKVAFVLGGNYFGYDFADAHNDEFNAISLNGFTVFGMKLIDGDLLMTVRMRDRNGHEVLSIVEGEIVVDTGVGDYDLVGSRITIKNIEGGLLIDLRKKENGIEILRGEFWSGRTGVTVDPQGLTEHPMNNRMTGCGVFGRGGCAIYGPL